MLRVLFAAVMLLASFAQAEEVFVINGRVARDNPLIAIAKLPPATYTIQVFSDDADPVSITVTISGGGGVIPPAPVPPAPPLATLRIRVEQLAAGLETSERQAIADNYAKIATGIKENRVNSLQQAESLIRQNNSDTNYDREKWKPLSEYLKTVQVKTLPELQNAFEQIAAGLRGGK